MTTQHTPEPWKLYESNGVAGIADENNAFIISAYMCGGDDMRRVVECVNALHDMDSKEIADIRAWAHGAGIGMALAMKDKAIGEYQLLVSDMEQQRDELQAKCERLESSLYNIGMDLEQLGLNTDDVTEALGGKDGIRQIEYRLAKAQGDKT